MTPLKRIISGASTLIEFATFVLDEEVCCAYKVGERHDDIDAIDAASRTREARMGGVYQRVLLFRGPFRDGKCEEQRPPQPSSRFLSLYHSASV